MTSPRVSVVIPTYNRGELLSQAVESALAQTFDDLEVIVADDGSDEGSLKVVAEFDDPRVVVLRLAHSGVPAVVRNAGLAKAHGEFVAFLDSDDVWHPDKLERQVAVLDRDPAVGLVCSNARVIGDGGEEIRALYLRPDQGVSGEVLEQLLDVNFVIASSAVARRELVEQAGRFTEAPGLRGVEDYDLWLRLGAESRFAYLPEPLLDYREHRGSLRRAVQPAAYWASLLAVVDNLDRFLDEDDPRRRTLVRRRRAGVLVQLARAQRHEGGSGSALRSLFRAVRLDARFVARRLVGIGFGALRGAADTAAGYR